MKRSVEKVEYLKRLLVGRPLKSAENDEQKLSRTAALALLSSDALSSIAYGTEQIVVVLVALSVSRYLVFITDRRFCYYSFDFIDLVLPSDHSCIPSRWWGVCSK